MNYVLTFVGGLVVGGGIVYYFYAKLKASIGKVETVASAVKTAVK